MIALVLSAGCLPELDFPEDTGGGPFVVDLTTCDYSLSEIGDGWGNSEDLGSLSVPASICGSLYGTGNTYSSGSSEGSYASDMDFVQFSVPEGSNYVLKLNWEAEDGDYDLYLFDQNYDEIDRSTASKPESCGTYLSAEASHFFIVAGWDGPPGKWQVDVLPNE